MFICEGCPKNFSTSAKQGLTLHQKTCEHYRKMVLHAVNAQKSVRDKQKAAQAVKLKERKERMKATMEMSGSLTSNHIQDHPVREPMDVDIEYQDQELDAFPINTTTTLHDNSLIVDDNCELVIEAPSVVHEDLLAQGLPAISPPATHIPTVDIDEDSVDRLMDWQNSGSKLKSNAELKRILTQLESIEACVSIEVPSGDKNTPASFFDVPGLHYRKLTSIIRATFASPLASKFHLSPFKLFHMLPLSGEQQHIFSEVYNSDAFIEENERVQQALVPPDEPDCNMCMLNQIPERLADFHVKWGTQKKDIKAHCQRELMHAVWKFLLDDKFLHAFCYGMVIKCADGIEWRVYPRIFTYSADYPEKVLLATIHDKGLSPCPQCLTPKTRINQMGLQQDSNFQVQHPWTYLGDFVCRAREWIYKMARPIGGTWVEDLLKPTSSVPTVNAFVDHLGHSFQLNELFVVNLMHEVELGVWKTLFTHLIRILYATAPDGHLVADTICRFSSNTSEMKKLATRDFKDFLQCSIPAFEGLLDEPHNSRLMKLLYRTAEWHGFAKFCLHTETTLAHLEAITCELGKLMREFWDATKGDFATYELPHETAARKRHEQQQNPMSTATGQGRKEKLLNLFTYKWHALSDYVRTIRLFGGTDGFSTQVLTNKRKAEQQIAKHVCQLEHARAAHQRDAACRHAVPQSQRHEQASEETNVGDPDLCYHILPSQANKIDLLKTLVTKSNDPVYRNFLPKLQDHLLACLMGREFDRDDQTHTFSHEERNLVHFLGGKIYSVQTCRLYYTSYDLQRQSDTINPTSHPNIFI
ncbi:unnamed protein product [Cyclocybe aegerita]|uniref:Uncharacterized protein n=1 Tax=Cyclocybe aegerita TaxID=1973307 RepID=A0A8S0VUK2_CYCAE|nr:unnamed protein product [Cyclocybe aegerita]